MPKIKTREIHRGNIKTFDRAQDLSARMRTVEGLDVTSMDLPRFDLRHIITSLPLKSLTHR